MAVNFVLQNQQVSFKANIANSYVEWGYQQEDEAGLMERRIDSWGIVDNTLWVVDHKTGSSQYKDKAFEQMTEYAEALRNYKQWQGGIQLVAAYPFSQKLFVQKFD